MPICGGIVRRRGAGAGIRLLRARFVRWRYCPAGRRLPAAEGARRLARPGYRSADGREDEWTKVVVHPSSARRVPHVRRTDRPTGRRANGLRKYLVEDERDADRCDADQECSRCRLALRLQHASEARGAQAGCSGRDRERPSIDDQHHAGDAEQDRAHCEPRAEPTPETRVCCSLRGDRSESSGRSSDGSPRQRHLLMWSRLVPAFTGY